MTVRSIGTANTTLIPAAYKSAIVRGTGRLSFAL